MTNDPEFRRDPGVVGGQETGDEGTDVLGGAEPGGDEMGGPEPDEPGTDVLGGAEPGGDEMSPGRG